MFRLFLFFSLLFTTPVLSQTCNYLAYDGFNYPSGTALNGLQGGTGWQSPWEVQGANNNVPGYQTTSGTPLTYLDLQTAGNYSSGGYVYLTAGRRLNTATGGPFTPWLNSNNAIGAGSAPLWTSVLLRKTEANDENVSVLWHSSNIAWCAGCNPVNHVAAGYFGSASNVNGERRWSLSINGIVYPTSVPVNINTTVFMVVKMEFGSTNTISLFVNPTTIGNNLPPTPSLIQTTTTPFDIRSLALYEGNDAGSGEADEIRMGASYACVAPDPTVMVNQPPVANFTMTPSSGNAPLAVTLDGSTSADPDGTIVSWSWNFGDGSPVTSGETVNHTFTATGILQVQLTVTDNNGVSHALTLPVTVFNPSGTFTCQARLNMLDLATCGNNNGRFVASNIAGVSLDLRNISNAMVPSSAGNSGLFENLSPGDYTLYLAGPNGCRDTFQIAVAVDSSTCEGWAPEPCGMKIGVGLEGLAYYSSTRMFKDYFKTAGEWITYDPTNATPGWNTGDQQYIPADINGYATVIPFSTPNGPRALRGIISANGYVPMGVPMRLLYDGVGTITMQGNVTVNANAPNQIDFTINDEGNIWFHLASSQQGDPVKNIRVIAIADAASYLTAPFRQNFLDKANSFSSIRYMDLMHTNGNGNITWANRTAPGYYSQAVAPGGGMAYEYIIQLANTMNKDIWLCVPHQADNDYITQMAAMFHDQLNPGIKVYLEYSNEVWNWIFSQANWVANNGPQNISYPRRYVERAQNTFRIWHQEWGPDKARVRRVLGTQNGYDWVTEEIMAHADPDDYDYISPSWYAGLDHSSNGVPNLVALGAAATAEDVLENATHTFHGFYPHWQMVYNTAKLYKKKVVNYEGGQHFTNFSVPAYIQAMYDAQVHPGMYGLYQEMLDSLRSLKSELPMAFVLSGPWQSIYGSWGHIFSVDDLPPYTDRPKYQVLLDNINLCTSSLPAALHNFTATCERSGVHLEWTVSDEKNVKEYHVEISDNGANWRSIANISLQQGIYPLHYQYNIQNESGPYFRLTTLDTDGRATYSAWRSVNCNQRELAQLFPNPSSVMVRLEIPASWNTETFSAQITDILGRVQSRKTIAQSADINIESLADGLYFIALYDEKGREVQRLKFDKFTLKK